MNIHYGEFNHQNCHFQLLLGKIETKFNFKIKSTIAFYYFRNKTRSELLILFMFVIEVGPNIELRVFGKKKLKLGLILLN